MSAPAAAAIARLETSVAMIREEARIHYGEDDKRFLDERKEREESLRRLYERVENLTKETRGEFVKAISDLENRVMTELAKMSLGVNENVTKIVNKTGELERARHEADLARARAEGEASGIAKAKTPTPTQMAVIQGVSGQLAAILGALFLMVLTAAGSWWAATHQLPAVHELTSGA